MLMREPQIMERSPFLHLGNRSASPAPPPPNLSTGFSYYLDFRELHFAGQFAPFRRSQVFVPLERALQGADLFQAESGAQTASIRVSASTVVWSLALGEVSFAVGAALRSAPRHFGSS